MNVAIIGAGAVGSASAWHISRRGYKVTLFEQFDRGHRLGSSHGSSRIIRKAYQDPLYAELMNEVFPLWRELEEAAGETLYNQTGILVFGKPDSEYYHSTRETLMSLKENYDILGHINVAKRFGGFHIDPDEEAIFQPEAGYLLADRCIEACLNLASGNGAELHFNTRADLSLLTQEFDAVIVCAGPWMPNILASYGFEAELNARLQRFAYFDAPMEPGIPVWIDGSDDHFYGFPDYGNGFKVGRHLYGPAFDADGDRPSDDESLQAIAKEARRRIGADVMLQSHDCVYTVTPNEDFRLGEIPADVPVYWASPCSGHGFKFAIWFGRLMADLVDGKQGVGDWPRFMVK